MQDLLATYLFQKKNCPLPGIGSLQLNDAVASVMPGEQRIEALPPNIELSIHDIPCEGLVNYIAWEQHVSAEEATAVLKQYCSKLKFMGTHEEVPLTEAGKFSVSPEGKLVFTPVKITQNYQPPVRAEKVIRVKDTHAILVGDTKTTNTEMSEFYSDEAAAPKDRWWIWAIVLFAVAASLIIIYLNDSGSSGDFGNVHKVNAEPAGKTYRAN